VEGDKRTQVVFGGLLHDVGKVVIRGFSEKGSHPKLGAKFIEDEIALHDATYAGSVLEQIRYHHARDLRSADIADDSLAYITYFADNISAGMDRKTEGDDTGFDKDAQLRKVFNIINGRKDDNTYDLPDYNEVRESIKESLRRIQVQPECVNSLLNLLEAQTDKIPSSTDKSQLIDVSLFDHAKTTAAIASCMYEYLEEAGISNYREALFSEENADVYYEKEMFLLFSCDMSGIQSFIYNISGEGALRQLRSRSFYLEIMLEHIADELLSRLSLSRANLLYTGGGHAYMLLPNTEKVRREIEAFHEELTEWLLENYKTDLYVAIAYESCSSDDLANKGDDKSRYRNLYKRLSEKLSLRKANRYSVAQLRALNFSIDKTLDHTRECKECHRSDLELTGGVCPLCHSFSAMSEDLVRKDVFVISEEGDLRLPFGKGLSAYTEDEYLKNQPDAIRLYTKNDWHTGIHLSTHIWMGDYRYPTKNGIGGYARDSARLDVGRGIKRLGVLRADVDNLGSIFTAGLPDEKISISRTSSLSRQLSYFFKYMINEVLDKGEYRVQIIYAGGDDVFLIGNWMDVIYAAMDIRGALNSFTGNGSLTISAGIGMYTATYPLARMAAETGMLESKAKHYKEDSKDSLPTKNAVALFTEEAVFSWDTFVNGVVGEKLSFIKEAFEKHEKEKGKTFIYKMIALLRDKGPIAVSRLAYLLARSFESGGGSDTQVSERFYTWAMDMKERQELVCALELYVYSIRE
jgi:CRISPR-associated protein Csm1